MPIHSCAQEVVGEDTALVCYFQGAKKGLVLNKTNANTIAELYGPQTENWHGRVITLFPTQVDYQGRQVPAIRVRTQRPAGPVTDGGQVAGGTPVLASSPVMRPAQDPPGGAPPVDDDEIPF